nr:arginase, hepatic isoform X2 [Parasteatoda tepidariorum]
MFSSARLIKLALLTNSIKEPFLKRSINSSSVGILGAPFNKGQPKEGVEKAPDALRKLGLIKNLTQLGVNVKDFGNIQFDQVADKSTETFGILKFPLTVGAACKKVSNAVKEVLQENRICVTIGGDHSLGLGTIHGHSEINDVCVLWVDAHADINTPGTTYSGFMHGLPCSFFVEELQKYQCHLEGFDWVTPRIKKENLAYIGLRDIDPLEKLILMKEGILHFTMADVDKLGIYEVTRRALEAINPSGKLSLHVSFDIDAICKLEAPSTGTPENFKALDIMEINPTLGTRTEIDNTLDIGMKLIKAFLGHSRRGSPPANVTDIPIARQ